MIENISASRTQDSPPDAPGRAPLRLLLIEDNLGDVRLIGKMLAEAGPLAFELENAARLSDGLEKLSQSPYDLVLLDLSLPDSSGYETFLRARSRFHRLPIIIFSGLQDEALASQAVGEGAQDYLIKGQIDSALLVRSIRYAIERQKSENALEVSEARYRRLFETTHDGILILDAQTGKVSDVNSYLVETLGYPRKEFYGRSLWELPGFVEEREVLEKAFRRLEQRKIVDVKELKAAAHDGRSLIVELHGSVFETENQKLFQLNLHDVTERKRVEAALQRAHNELEMQVRERTAELMKANQQLKDDIAERMRTEEALGISKRIVKAQEEERRWVARELHDSVNQILSSIKFWVESASEKMLRESDAVSKELSMVKLLVEKAIQEVRRISQNLRPTVLGELGFIAALRSLCDDFRQRTSQILFFRASNFPKKLPHDIELALYRIVQEALSNVLKHSQATMVTVRLSQEGAYFQISIKDNGKGFDPAAVQSRKPAQSGLGLIHIRERAAFIGGRVHVRAAPGQGTEIIVQVPVDRRGLSPTAGIRRQTDDQDQDAVGR